MLGPIRKQRMSMFSPHVKSPAPPNLVSAIVLCCVILAFGAEVRFSTLGLESVDLEEYACVGGIQAPDWATFFRNQRDLYPYGAPLAPSLIYFWTRFVGDSIVAIRTLFAGISMLSLVLCYCLAHALFRDADAGRRHRAGLVTALCFSLSPLHVFHAQEARMYALVSLFTLLAMIGLAQGLRDGKGRWWCLNCCANAALLASHYFTVFLLPVQGLALLIWERRISRRLLLWSLFQGLLLLALFWWVTRIPRQAEDLYSYYSIPSTGAVLTHLFARDSTTLSASAFFPSSQAWNWLPGSAGAVMRAAHRYFDFILAGLSVFALLVSAVAAFYHYRHKNDTRAWTWFMLSLWTLLPTVLMVMISWLWQPIYGSRYVMYSSFAFYLVLGAIGATIRRPGVFRGFLLCLTVLFGYQLALAFPPETRTAWRQALEKVREDGGEESVLLLEDPFWLPVLAINDTKGGSVPIAAAFERNSLCEAADFLVSRCDESGRVWVLLVLTTDFDETPFVRCLVERALRYDRYFYPGERKLALYHVHPGSESTAEAKTGSSDGLLFGPLITALSEEEHEQVRKDFRERIRYLKDEEGGFWLRLGEVLTAHSRDGLADAVFQHALGIHGLCGYELARLLRECRVDVDGARMAECIMRDADSPEEQCARIRGVLQLSSYEQDNGLLEMLGNGAVQAAPQCAEGYAFLGLARHRQEEHLEALPYFRQSFALNPRISPEIAEAFGISLAASGFAEEALQVFGDALTVWPEFNWLHMRAGIVYAGTGRHAEAVDAFRKALEPIGDDFYITYLLMQSLLALQRYEEALLLAERESVAQRPEFWVHLVRWRVFVGSGRHDKAAITLKELASLKPDYQELYDTLYGKPDHAAAQRLVEAAREAEDPIAQELALAVEHLRH